MIPCIRTICAWPCHRTIPWPPPKPSPSAALAGEVLLFREPTSKTRIITEQVLAACAVAPGDILELHSRETIREGVALGLGVSAFFSSECPPDPRIAYRPLDADGRGNRLIGYLVCLSERRRSALIRALRTIARELARAEAVDGQS